jgi:thioredoxin
MEFSEFTSKILEARQPVVVDLWAPWCGPCRAVKPILEELAREYAGRVELWEINADESAELLRALHVYGIPTLLVYKEGQEAARYIGAKPAQTLRSLFESLASGTLPAAAKLAPRDRVVRLMAGIVLVIAALQFSFWPLFVAGGIVMFTAVYDRCPIWRAVTSGLTRLTTRT